MINTAVCGQLNKPLYKTQSLAADQACVTICHHELNEEQPRKGYRSWGEKGMGEIGF